MAFNNKYFRLFEVRILHEYYLLAGADHIFYDLSANDRQEMLMKRVLGGQYKLLNDLDIVPTPSTTQLLRNHKLIFKKTATGFVVLAQGLPTLLPISGTDGVLPFIPFGNEKELAQTDQRRRRRGGG